MTTRPIATRASLLRAVARYLDALAASPQPIGPANRAAAQALGAWIAARRGSGRAADVVAVCTGNSRRSILAATMGNAVAAFLGLPDVRFSSAGTVPSAFDPRTIASLAAAGFAIDPTGDLARPDEGGPTNPRYRVRWGTAPGQEAVEFSKRLGDVALPVADFAALLVCAEAAAECPLVPGASVRVALPLADPKCADGTPGEAARYAETRDVLGRTLLAALAPLAERLPA